MAKGSKFDPLTDPCLLELEAVADRYMREGLDPAQVLAGLAAVAIKTSQAADPRYRQFYLDYFAAAVRGAGDVTVTDE